MHGGRWNPPNQFRAVYGSLQPATALEEALALARYYGTETAQMLPLVIAAGSGQLEIVIDLTNPDLLAAFGVDIDELAAEDWRNLVARRRESLTQALGRAAAGEGVEALIVPSFAVAGARNIVIFPDSLPTGRALRAKGVDL